MKYLLRLMKIYLILIANIFDEVGHLILTRALLEVFDDEDKITLDFTSLVYAGYYPKEEVDDLFEYFQNLMLRRINLDYQIYGYLLKDHPQMTKD